MNKNSKIFICGHKGMVGSAIYRKLLSEGFSNIVVRSSKELDLTIQQDVNIFFEQEKPEFVFLAAAKVGGIIANNTYKAEFLYKNLSIQNNVINSSYLNKVKKLLFLGSSCIYPKSAIQPLTEDSLLTGLLEPTNEPYAIAKIAGIKMCEAYRFQYGCNFISAMPTNLYGINDNYNLETSHVLPALIRRFCEAKDKGDSSVTLWGTGTPLREFLYVDDLADACFFLMENYNESQFVNVGSGVDISIRDLAEMVQKIVGFIGKIEWDTSKPDGTPRKLLNIDKMKNLGWVSKTELESGIKLAFKDYQTKMRTK